MSANRNPTIRTAAVLAMSGILAGCVLQQVTAPPGPAYEIWAIDQGTNRIHILAPDPSGRDGKFAETDVMDLGAHGIDMPHMIDFTSDYAYAFVANVQSGNVAVIRASDRKLLQIVDTGHMTHMAAVTPDDRAVIVDVMHADGTMVEILIDRERETFSIGRQLKIADDAVFSQRSAEFAGSSPVCHAYSADGRYAFVTLGPSLNNGGLLIMDLADFRLTRVHPVSEVRVNCGTIRSPDGSKIYMTGGSLEEGHWYVFDTATQLPLAADIHGSIRRDSRGKDAHGVWFTPDGRELWMVNRATSNAIVIDPATDDVIAEIDHVGPSPDILTMSPDGRYAFITLRGPKPRSGPHQVAGSRPGVAVVDVNERKLLTVIRPARGDSDSDFHGIGMRLR